MSHTSKSRTRRPSPRYFRALCDSLECRLMFDGVAVNLADYFPLSGNITWHYTGTINGSPVHIDDSLQPTVLDGVAAYRLEVPTGEHLFFSFTNNALILHEVSDIPGTSITVIAPNFEVAPQVVTTGTSYTFSSTVTVINNGIPTPAPESVTTDVGDFESVTVPAGTFTALKVTLTATVAGNEFTPIQFWFVQGLGPVQIVVDPDGGPPDAILKLEAPPTQDMTFLHNLYADALHRDPDPSSQALFAAQLDSGVQTNGAVASQIITSTEYRTNVIQGLYQTILGRDADASGLNAWLAAFAAGGTVEQLKAQFYGSQEYFNEHGGTTAGLVDAYYVAFLNRHAESDGLAYWQARLDAGADRSAIALEIESSSQEGAQDIVIHAYNTYLLRGPDDAGLAFWTAQVQSGVSETVIIQGFLESQEYFNRA